MVFSKQLWLRSCCLSPPQILPLNITVSFLARSPLSSLRGHCLFAQMHPPASCIFQTPITWFPAGSSQWVTTGDLRAGGMEKPVYVISTVPWRPPWVAVTPLQFLLPPVESPSQLLASAVQKPPPALLCSSTSSICLPFVPLARGGR